MRLRSLFTSTVFHVGLIVAVTVGVSFQSPRDIELPPAITVEFAKIDKVAQTPKPAPPKPKPKVDKPKPKPKAKPKQDKPKPAPTNKSKTPDVPKPKPKEVKPKPEPPKQKPKEVQKPKDPPKPKVKETNKKTPPKEPERDFGSVLKNLADVSDPVESNEEKKTENEGHTPGQDAPLGVELTISEVDALRRQLEGCWNVPIGARGVEDMLIDVNILVNPDKSVRQASIVDTGRYNRDSFFRAVADTAIRAVRSPACSPLRLPEGKYDLWKNIIVEFNPREMF